MTDEQLIEAVATHLGKLWNPESRRSLSQDVIYSHKDLNLGNRVSQKIMTYVQGF